MLAARCLALIGPIGVAILTARVLGPQERGHYFYVAALAAIAAQLVSMGFHSSNTVLVARDPALLPRALGNGAWIALSGGCAAALIAIIFEVLVGEGIQRHASILFVIGLCPTTLLFIHLSNLVIAVNRTSLFNVLIILNAAATLTTAALVAISRPSVNLFLVALIFSGAISSLAAWIALAKDTRVPGRFDSAFFFEGVAFAARAHTAILLGFLMSRTGVLVIRERGTFAELGQWSIALQTIDALLILPGTVSLVLFPVMVRADAPNRWRELRTKTLQIGVVMAIVCLLAAALARPMVDFLFGAEYGPAATILIALLPSVFFLSLTSVTSQFLSAFGIPRTQLAAWLSGLTLQVGASMLLFERFGAIGLALVQSAAAAFVCCWLLLSALRYSPR